MRFHTCIVGVDGRRNGIGPMAKPSGGHVQRDQTKVLRSACDGGRYSSTNLALGCFRHGLRRVNAVNQLAGLQVRTHDSRRLLGDRALRLDR